MTLKMLPHAATAAVAILLTATAPALAASDDATRLDLETTPGPSAQSAASSGGLVRTIVGLAVVLGVIYGLHWVLKRIKASREDRASGSGLATLATLPLGPNRSMHLIRSGADIILVGSTEHGIVPIKVYTEEQARATGLLPDEPTPEPEPAFTGFSSAGVRVGDLLEPTRRGRRTSMVTTPPRDAAPVLQRTIATLQARTIRSDEPRKRGRRPSTRSATSAKAPRSPLRRALMTLQARTVLS